MVDVDLDVLDLEDARLVLVSADEVDGSSQPLPTKYDVRQARIADLWETGLLAEVEGDVAHVRLDLGEGEGELVMMFVGNGVVGGELDVVVSLHGDGVGEKVAAREGEVLDDEIDGVVGVLDARDGDVSDLQA